jgi:hypothetical protein
MESLDSILSGRDAASGNSPPVEEQQVAPAAEGESQQQQQTEGEAEGGEQQGQRMVPHEALHAEKQKVKRYTEEVADFRRQLSETNAAWERRMAELVQAVKPKQEQPRPDFFENPEAATQHTVQPQFDHISQTLLANAQLIAGIKYGDDKVAEAEQAFIQAMQSQKLDPADYQKVVSSPNRYAAAVQWHQRQQAQAEIGDDPAAFRAKVEAELREKILAEMQGGGQQAQAQQAAPVMPSNLASVRNVGARSGPAWGGPSPIQDIFARKRSG